MAIDYTSFTQGDQTGAISKRWWAVPKADRAKAVSGVVKALAEYDTRRSTQYQISARLYGNAQLMGVNGLSYSKVQATQTAMKDRMSYNVVQSASDAVTAKIAKNKPRALFLTSGGDWKLQRKAKKLDKFVEGIFYENEAYSLGPIIFRDGCVFGDGFVHVYREHGRVKWERVLAGELYVDWVEAFYGKPLQMHRVKNVDKAILKDLYPEKAKLIEQAKTATGDKIGTNQNVADQVTVVESWRLPSGPEAKDGLHSINLEEGNLFEEPWTRDHFPFAQFSWSKRLYGFFGQGLAEQIQNIQLEINKILWVIQRSFHLAGSFKVLLANGSKVVKEHLNNDIGAIVTYTGTEPKYVVPPIVPMEIYQHLQTLKNAAFEHAGISMLSAASVKPAGLNSGKALREYNDIESDRFQTVGQAYEKFFLDLAKLSIEEARDIYEKEKKFSVTVPGKKFIESIDWKDVNLEDDEYFMKAFPVSSLPNDPAGRLQTVQEYVQAGFISPRVGRRLLDFPDIEQIENLQNAEEDFLHEIFEKMVDEGIYTKPEPFDDLALAREMALEYYAQGKLGGLEEDRLELLRTFLRDLGDLQAKAAPPPTPGAPGAPQAQPAPPPTSNLVPNVPVAGAA